ncbi:MAG: ABC transporter permease, partial [Mesorhizobium sp.]
MSKAMEPDLQSPLGRTNGQATKEWSHPSDHWLRGFVIDNRAALGTLGVFIFMMAVFIIANPTVFTTWYLYSSVLTTLPVALFVVVPLVFVVTCDEIDLSFPATMGFASWVFA